MRIKQSARLCDTGNRKVQLVVTLSSWKLPLQFTLDSLRLLLILKILFTQGFPRRGLIIFKLNSEKGVAFPATEWSKME
jgi:hypothetical protein